MAHAEATVPAMSSRHVTPLGAVGRGLAAGAVGTAVMTGWQELSARLQSSGESASQEEPAGEAQGDPWAEASSPAQVARRIIEGVFHKEVPPERISLLTHAMHWSYGTAWGAAYGLIQGTSPARALPRGLAFGASVWGMSYVQLVPMGLYEPPWRYPAKDLALELSFHLAYGAGVAAGYAALSRRA